MHTFTVTTMCRVKGASHLLYDYRETTVKANTKEEALEKFLKHFESWAKKDKIYVERTG